MNLIILDKNFLQVHLLDSFESLIWTEKYNGCGNFEIYTPITDTLVKVIQQGYYIWMNDSEQIMIVEDIKINTEVEKGNYLILSGRSLESILDRRIVWKQTRITGNLQNGVKRLITENVISPEIPDRRIDNFLFQDSTDPAITSLKIDKQCTGDNLYEAIESICKTYNLGFRITLNENNKFVFMLYAGADRSYDQVQNPYVIFSPSFENIINSDYLESEKTLKTVTLVAGEGEGIHRKTVIVGGGAGLERRELYTDARDLQSNTEVTYDDQEILDSLRQDLEDLQQSLADEQKALTDLNTEYNQKRTDHNSLDGDYASRISILNSRISYYQGMITHYYKWLDENQKTVYNNRASYKTQIQGLQSQIDALTETINNCNDTINNDRKLTYSSFIICEQSIDAAEESKKPLEESKRSIESQKEEAEKGLPDFATTLDDYEKKISKYQGVIDSDNKKRSEESTNFSKETTDYNKKKSEHETAITRYNQQIATCRQQITYYEQKLIEDTSTMNQSYDALLRQRGKDKLSENVYTKAFTSEIEATKNFVYKKDFYKGDVVQIVNEYGIESKVRVEELIISQNIDGFKMYPTFSIVEEV